MEENVFEGNGYLGDTKFCKSCGKKIAAKAVFCPLCGCQVEEIHSAQSQPQVIVNNQNQNVNQNVAPVYRGKPKNKMVALALCLFLGFFGAHKFYEEKFGMGILYIFTGGLFVFGAIMDFFVILGHPNTYYVE